MCSIPNLGNRGATVKVVLEKSVCLRRVFVTSVRTVLTGGCWRYQWKLIVDCLESGGLLLSWHMVTGLQHSLPTNSTLPHQEEEGWTLLYLQHFHPTVPYLSHAPVWIDPHQRHFSFNRNSKAITVLEDFSNLGKDNLQCGEHCSTLWNSRLFAACVLEMQDVEMRGQCPVLSYVKLVPAVFTFTPRERR